ncbi:MAG: methylenetetrahydrofolate reductase C-terminal domain-containing protein [Coriobacteriales bacterium]|nr:methylenetetrahydrofolate reductase C-terminal domain-containing protein [Coriobacteriales bacterium]
MIITRPRDPARIVENLETVGARSVFIVGCQQCATVAHTGGEVEVGELARFLTERGYEVSGTEVSEVTCHLAHTRVELRRHAEELSTADAVIVLTCGAGVQTVADAAPETPVFPGLDSAFLGNVIRNGVFEERCQMCGQCVLDLTAGICPVTTCPKGLLNGPCGGMWDGKCEVMTDRECTHVRIHNRLKAQGRARSQGSSIPAKDYSVKLKPGSVNLRAQRERARRKSGGDR